MAVHVLPCRCCRHSCCCTSTATQVRTVCACGVMQLPMWCATKTQQCPAAECEGRALRGGRRCHAT